MAVNLYLVRAILDILGVVDYGIYNVVGGVVAMFSFINSTLATSSQRYFSIELAKGDLKRLNEWFCLNITTFAFFIIFFLIIAETIGLWFVNTQMTIPEERMFAANVVYQLSIISFCIHFFNIPYTALIIAHERMSAFAYISIIEAFLKLLVVFVLTIIPWDKLISYGFLMFLISCGITSSYIIYNLRFFKESKYSFYWNKAEMLELLSFSGWHFMGTFSVVIRSQGINILLNLFFNPAINAARAIAYQIYTAVSQLSHNFFVAVKPQIYKNYATKDFNSLYILIIRSTIMCSYLVSILVFPILANTTYVLGLWLKEIPNYSVIFTQLVLINGLIDSVNSPTTASILATGKIRNYELVVASLTIANLPLSYIILKLGADPTSTMIVSIAISIIVTFVRAYFSKKMNNFPLLKYLKLLGKTLLVSLFIWLIILFFFLDTANNFLLLLGESILIISIISILYYIFLFEKADKKYFKKIVINKMASKCHNKNL